MYNLFWRVPGIHTYGAKTTIDVPVGQTVSDKASLRFTGKGAANTGKIQQENLMRLLESFAADTAPSYPTVGQIWYDTGTSLLKVCVSSPPAPVEWRAVGAGIQTTQPNEPAPAGPSVGDLWMQITGSASSILYVYTGIGRYPEQNGEIGGWAQVYPSPEIVAGREEYESMYSLLEQLIGPTSSRGSAALLRSITNLSNFGALDDSMRTAFKGATPLDALVLNQQNGDNIIANQASALSKLAFVINSDSFNALNYSEVYVCGYNPTSLVVDDVDGAIMADGVEVTVPKGPLYTSNAVVDGFILWDTTGTLTTFSGSTLYFVVRFNNNQWEYDPNQPGNVWLPFTPVIGMRIIGTLTALQNDSGSPGLPPGLALATPWYNAIELTQNAIGALKVDPNSNDWDTLLAAAKYALNRLDIPADSVRDISPIPFVFDGRQAPDSLLALSLTDARFPSQDRRANRQFGSVTMNRLFTETVNMMHLGLASRYVLKGMAGSSGTNSTFASNVTVDAHASFSQDAGASGGSFGTVTRTKNMLINFNTADELDRFFGSAEGLQIKVVHAPSSNTAADLNLKSITDNRGLFRILANRTFSMNSTANAMYDSVNLGALDLSNSFSVLATQTNGTANVQLQGRRLSSTSFEFNVLVLAGGATSGTCSLEWSVINDNEIWSGGRVYPTILNYVPGVDSTGGNFNDTTPITPLSITSQPSSSTVNNGAPASFGVVVTGTGPVTYQWYRNSVAIGGAVASTYSFSSTLPDNGATFYVIATSPYNFVTSNTVTLTVTNITAPTLNLANQTILAGSSSGIGNFTGSGITWTGTRNGTPIVVGTAPILISGSNLTLDPGYTYLTNNGDVYALTATNGGGAASGTSTITITPRTFTLQQAPLAWRLDEAINMRLATELGTDANIANAVITSGSLPTGVTLNGTLGWVQGTPTVYNQSFSFSVTFYPEANKTLTASRTFNYSGTVSTISGQGVLSVGPDVFDGGDIVQNKTYINNPPTAQRGYGASISSPGKFYEPPFVLNSGSMPPGMTLTRATSIVNSGEEMRLTGTPTTLGSYTCNVTILNTHVNVTKTFTVHVVATSSITTASSPFAGTVGTSMLAPLFSLTPDGYPQSFTNFPTLPTVTGTVPPGTAVNYNGGNGNAVFLVGTPTTPGSYTFSVSGVANNTTNGPSPASGTWTVNIS